MDYRPESPADAYELRHALELESLCEACGRAAVAMDAAREAVEALPFDHDRGWKVEWVSRAAVLNLLTPEGGHDA